MRCCVIRTTSNSHRSDRMASTPVNSRERIATAWTGSQQAQGLAASARAPIAAADQGGGESARDGVLRAGVRFIRNAAIGMALLVLVPLVAVSTGGDSLWFEYSGTRQRLAEVERLRPLMSPRDPAITPMRAGMAFRALEAPRAKGEIRDSEFPLREVAIRGERAWERELTPTMFSGLMLPVFRGHPSVQTLALSNQVIAKSQGRFSPEELAYLRGVAESPVWRDFDRVASAAQVDLIGGKFALPFRDDAFALDMPTMRYADTKLLANAGVVRAAYFAATGQPERAEAALRSVVSFGFAMIDNGTTLMDALIGRAVVDIGRGGLQQWYALAGDARGLELAAPLPKGQRPKSSIDGTRIDADAMRARLLADASDPRAPRAVRLESLRQLSFASCGSPRGLLFGHSADVDAAFDNARTSLARNPSDRAFIDLLYVAPARVPENVTSTRLSDQLIVGAATVAGMVLHNPRVAACTRIVRAYD